jgi:hypothetical protein
LIKPIYREIETSFIAKWGHYHQLGGACIYIRLGCLIEASILRLLAASVVMTRNTIAT